MCKFILVALLVFFSINGVASAAEDDVFEIEAEGNYRMKAGASIDLAKNTRTGPRYIWPKPLFIISCLSRCL